MNRTGLDGELCGVFPDGTTSFGMIQTASDAGNAAGLAYFIFDLLHLDADDIGAMPLIERKGRLTDLLSDVSRRCTTATITAAVPGFPPAESQSLRAFAIRSSSAAAGTGLIRFEGLGGQAAFAVA